MDETDVAFDVSLVIYDRLSASSVGNRGLGEFARVIRHGESRVTHMPIHSCRTSPSLLASSRLLLR
jgi:hypothetical protein